MMSEDYYIGAYWGSRPESLAACTDRLLCMLVGFRECHEWVAHWRDLKKHRDDPLPPEIALTSEALAARFGTLDPFPPSEAGYTFYAWSSLRGDHQYVGLSIGCGAPSKYIPNRVVLDLPKPSPDTASLYDPQVLRELLLIVVRAWQPDSAMLTSSSFRDEIQYPDDTMPDAGKPFVGWMTYLRAKRLSSLAGNPPCETVDLPGLGKLFVVTDDHRFSVENSTDVEIALALQRYLEEHGALEVIPLDQSMD